MEKTQVSNHKLASDYSIGGKLKTIVIGWTIYLAFLIVRQIPEIKKILLEISLEFLTGNFWYFFGILMITGTIITLTKKHPFVQLNIYNSGIGFIDKNGVEKYFDYSKIKIRYGKMRESFIMELEEEKKTTFEYGWKEFTQADVLKNNLERYGIW